MRTTPYALLLFFVCLNLSLYMMNEADILPPYEEVQPYTQPSDMLAKFAHIDLSSGTLLVGSIAFVASVIFGLLTGNLILGGTVGLILLSISILSPVAAWVLLGFPYLLAQIGVNPIIVTAITVLCAFSWYWFLFSLVAQRQVEY